MDARVFHMDGPKWLEEFNKQGIYSFFSLMIALTLWKSLYSLTIQTHGKKVVRSLFLKTLRGESERWVGITPDMHCPSLSGKQPT